MYTSIMINVIESRGSELVWMVNKSDKKYIFPFVVIYVVRIYFIVTKDKSVTFLNQNHIYFIIKMYNFIYIVCIQYVYIIFAFLNVIKN